MAMHHTRLKKAKGLIGELTDMEAITKLLLENQYTDEEVGEVLAALTAGDQSPAPPVKPAPAKEKKPQKITDEVEATENDHYEEWRCEIKNRQVEKLKKLRACVKISDEEAETLNFSARQSPRADYVIMYFKPE